MREQTKHGCALATFIAGMVVHTATARAEEPVVEPAPDVAVIEVDFTIAEQTVRRRCGPRADPWHRGDRPDRLVWVPTATLWRELVERVRARRAARVTAAARG